jgi:hypothetical protein
MSTQTASSRSPAGWPGMTANSLSTRFDTCNKLKQSPRHGAATLASGDKMKVHSTSLALAILFTASLSACARSIHVKDYDDESATAPVALAGPVKLEVENHNWADVVLYVLHDGVQTRFTQVAAAHNLSIEIPERLQGQMGIIRIAARRIGGTDSYVSQAISLRGNSAVRFTIESSLNHSSVGVW